MTELDKRQDRSPVPTDWTYAPAPESTDVVHLQDRYGLYVGGEWLTAKEHFTTVSPRDEAPLAEVAQASAADVHGAVAVRARGVQELVEAARLGAREVHVPDRAHPGRALP